MKGLTHFSLCSGIGGLDLAAEWAGFETIGQCEIDEYASKVLAKNFKGVKNYGDIRTITAELLEREGIGRGEITVLSAGIPCQPYSFAGKGLGDSDERDLEQELIRVIGELRPRWVIVENTPGLFARQNQRYFDRILNDVSALGYRVGWGMWGACDVGAPHRRERVFIICRNADLRSDETEQKISKKNVKPTGVCGDVSHAVVERCYTGEIQRGEFTESRRTQDERRLQKSRVQFNGICSGISDTNGIGLGERGVKKTIRETEKCRRNNRERKETDAAREWWEAEPDVGRVADGVSHRLDRLRCLGNAVVPQQAYPIFKAIAEYEKGLEK